MKNILKPSQAKDLTQSLLGRHARCPRLLAPTAAGTCLWLRQEFVCFFSQYPPSRASFESKHTLTFASCMV